MSLAQEEAEEVEEEIYALTKKSMSKVLMITKIVYPTK